MTRHHAVVVANSTADLPGPGEGMPWLVSCPACVARSVAAATHADEPWHGKGEWFAGDLHTAKQLAERHNTTTTPPGDNGGEYERRYR